MVDVVGVKFKNAGKVYFFGPGTMQLERGDHVIVETARGLEYGTVAMGNRQVSEEEIVSPLKDIVRIATEADGQKHLQNLEKRSRAMQLCQEKIDAHKLEMKLVDVEYTFDNSKVVFYFTADGRVDFRELVKDLAAVFRMRIELRQIGVRDEAKMLGGVGSCGRGLCCHTWLREFEPVSIKMAKVQNLSLNPTKISGICGRLMCCLKYENDLYSKLKKGMPNTGERVKTPDGRAVVVDTNILESTVRTRLILEEASADNDNEEKLSTEFYIYDKDEIRRQGKKNPPKKGKGRGKGGSGSDLDQMDSETKKEIEQLMKD
ncbi:MAG: stage 0 sporulation family protein [Firmicutes bacterium]|nr:stage 0 sporulation family protein [Bacillota bacterium]